MRMMLIKGRLPGLLRSLSLSRPNSEVMVTVSKVNYLSPDTIESDVFHLNHPDLPLKPFFPNDAGFFEGCTACEATKVDGEMFIVTVVAEDKKDAKMIAIHVISFIAELAQ